MLVRPGPRHCLTRRAAMLPDVPAGVSPAGGNCPVATVVILGGGKGDRPVGSPGVNVSGGQARAWSDPSREASQPTGCSGANQDSLEKAAPREADCGSLGSAELFANGRRPVSSAKELGTRSRRTPRGRRGRHVGTERAGKARNHSMAAEAPRPRQGHAYKPQGGEIAGCRRVGRMGPDKR